MTSTDDFVTVKSSANCY